MHKDANGLLVKTGDYVKVWMRVLNVGDNEKRDLLLETMIPSEDKAQSHMACASCQVEKD